MLLDDPRPRVVVLVDAVAEAHQLLLAVLHALEEVGDVLGRLDPAQHPQDGLVGAAVKRPVQRGDSGRDRRVGIDLGGADTADGVGRAVLLVVGVEDEEHVERLRQPGIGLVLHLGLLEHHREEVLGVAEVVVRIDVGKPQVVAVGEGRQRRHLRDQPDRRHVALLGIVDLLGVRVEGREGADAAEQHPHRMRVVAEGLEQVLDVLVDEGVVGDVEGPALELGLGRQLAEDQQVGDLQVGGVLAELLDRIAAVLEDALVTVDVGDLGAAGGRVGEGRVVGHHPEVVVFDLDLAKVHRLDRVVGDLQLVGLAGPVVGDGQRVAARGGDASVVLLGLLLGGHPLSSGRLQPWHYPIFAGVGAGAPVGAPARGAQPKLVIARSSARRSSISARSRRDTRSVPKSSTLNEASTVP